MDPNNQEPHARTLYSDPYNPQASIPPQQQANGQLPSPVTDPTQLGQGVPPVTPPTDPKKGGPNILVIVVIVGVVLVLICGLIVLLSSGGDDTATNQQATEQQAGSQTLQPAKSIELEEANNAINQDLSGLDDEKDYPNNSLEDMTLGL